MSKILVTGADGQLGSEFQFLAHSQGDHEFLFAELKDLDITDSDQVLHYMEQLKPDVLINCAAYTAVDRAEDEQELSRKVNVEGVENLVSACLNYGTILFHYSTDYVFNGKGHRPYLETDEVDPVGVYGRTKRAGEEAALRSSASVVVIRTSWVYSVFGANFVKTMLRLGTERDSLNIVYDQIGTPTNARDLALATLQILSQEEKLKGRQQVFHFSNEGVTSWYDFAVEIFSMAGIRCEVAPILSKDYPTKAQRPHYSVLDKAKIKTFFGLEIPHWKSSLAETLKELTAD